MSDRVRYCYRSVATPLPRDPRWPNVKRFARTETVLERLDATPYRPKRSKHDSTRQRSKPSAKEASVHKLMVTPSERQVTPFFAERGERR